MLTGSDYVASLDDGRLTYFEGRRVSDLLDEPAFATPARAIAAGYDQHFSPRPGATNPLVVAPRSVEELRERADVVHTMDLALAVTYGSLMTLLTAAPRMSGVDPVYKRRVEAYVEDATVGTTSASPSASPMPRVIERGRRRSRMTPTPTSASSIGVRTGVVIRGAKLHISAASLVHDLMVMPTKAMKPGEEDYAITCAVPVNSPGVRIINTTYHPRRARTFATFPSAASAACQTASSSSTMCSCPHERVFLDGETSNATVFAHSFGTVGTPRWGDGDGDPGGSTGRAGAAHRRGQRPGRAFRTSATRSTRCSSTPRCCAPGWKRR